MAHAGREAVQQRMGALEVELAVQAVERCDGLVAIPMAGSVESLNVSVAAGVMLFETVRQRKAKQAG